MKSKYFTANNKYMILKHGLKENNVSRTCELFGISRTTFYNWQRAYEREGIIGLEAKEPKKSEMPNKVSKSIEQEILEYVSRYPNDGPKRIYYELKAEGIEIGESGIYNVLKRNNLTKRAERVEYSKGKKLQKKPNKKLDKEILKLLNKQETHPGYLSIQRIDFMGTFHGIGRIYQYSFYDTASKWIGAKLYNKKQDIDIWHHFEGKIVYLLKTFNVNIENLVTDRTKEFLPYFIKDNGYKSIINELNINHIFICPDTNVMFKDLKLFNEFLIREFYTKIALVNELNSFTKVERAFNGFIRDYNFNTIISEGPNKGKTPVETVIEKAKENNADLDTLPLWILALINKGN